MNKKLTILLASSLLFLGSNAIAGDAAAGKAKSTTCAACHGADGTSPMDTWPNLKGQKEGYLVKQITAFRDGDRKDPMMSRFKR